MDTFVDVEMANSVDGGQISQQTKKDTTSKDWLKANQIKVERMRSISQSADYNDVVLDLELYNDTDIKNINVNKNDLHISYPIKSQPKPISKCPKSPTTPMSSLLLSTSFSLHDNRSSSHVGPEEFIELVRQKQDFNCSSFCRPGNRRRTVSENQASLNLKFPQSLRLKYISETKQKTIIKDPSLQQQQLLDNNNHPITKNSLQRKNSLDQHNPTHHYHQYPPQLSLPRPYPLPLSSFSNTDSMSNYPKFNVGSPTSPYSDLLHYGRSPSDHLILWKGANKRSKIIKLSNAEEESIEEEDEGQLNLESIIETVLRTHSAYDAMEKHARVIILDIDLKVGSAFDALAYDAIHAAPLWDGVLKLYVGMLTMTDFITILQHYIDQPDILSTIREDPVRKWRDFLLKQQQQQRYADDKNNMETSPDNNQSTTYTCLEDNINNNNKTDNNNDTNTNKNLNNNTNSNINTNINSNNTNNNINTNNNNNSNIDGLTISCGSSLQQLTHHLLSRKVHRVLVVNPDSQNPLYLASHRKTLHYIWSELPPLSHSKCTTHNLNKTLHQLSLGTFSHLLSVNMNTPVNQVFSILLSQSLSSIPVVNDSFQVVDLFRKADVMSLITEGNFSDLYRPIKEVLVYARNGFEGLYSCRRDDTAYNVISAMVDLQLHQVVVLDDGGCLEGVVTISDVLNLLLRLDSVEDSD